MNLATPLVLAMLVCAVAAPDARPAGSFTSRAARAAHKKYEEAVERAKQDYDRRVEAARKVAESELADAMKAATRHGDLDEANRIKAAVGRLKPNAAVTGSTRLLGAWQVRYANGIERTYEVRNDGTATWTEAGRAAVVGRFKQVEPEIVYDENKLAVERWTVVGDRLFIEHFNPASGYPKARPLTLGVATRVEQH